MFARIQRFLLSVRISNMAYEYSCPEPDCGFRVRTGSEYETFEHAELHAEEKHLVWHSGEVLRETTTVV